MQESLHWNNGSVLLFIMKWKGARFPIYKTIFLPTARRWSAEVLAVKHFQCKKFGVKKGMVQLDLWSAFVRHFLCEHWNSVKNSYVFGLTRVECHCASLSGTGASDEKFYVLIQRLWKTPDSGYLISTAPKGLTDISSVIQRLQFQCQL